MVLSVGAQDNLASRPVKQRCAHDPLELRDALGDDRRHQIELLRSRTKASRFRDGNEGTHRGDGIHSSRFTKTEPSTSAFFRRTGATRFPARPLPKRIQENPAWPALQPFIENPCPPIPRLRRRFRQSLAA